MHILSAKQFTIDDITRIINRTQEIEEHPYRYTQSLTGKVLGTLFLEPSTRTKVGFQVAIQRLGGTSVDFPESSSLKKGESLVNTVKSLSQLADVLVIRHPDKEMVSHLANYSDVPVINAGDGANEHPTQALLDLYTITKLTEEETPFDRFNITFTGDLIRSRTVRSLLYLLQHYGNVRVCFGNNINREDIAKGLNHIFAEEKNLAKFLPGTDVLYMTRNQVERHDDLIVPIAPKFVLTPELADTLPENAIIMHPLPCGSELPIEINNNPRAAYFNQVKNGMWVRMAILWQMLVEEEK